MSWRGHARVAGSMDIVTVVWSAHRLEPFPCRTPPEPMGGGAILTCDETRLARASSPGALRMRRFRCSPLSGTVSDRVGQLA